MPIVAVWGGERALVASLMQRLFDTERIVKMLNDAIVSKLNELIQLDYDAIQAYERAIAKIEGLASRGGHGEKGSQAAYRRALPRGSRAEPSRHARCGVLRRRSVGLPAGTRIANRRVMISGRTARVSAAFIMMGCWGDPDSPPGPSSAVIGDGPSNGVWTPGQNQGGDGFGGVYFGGGHPDSGGGPRVGDGPGANDRPGLGDQPGQTGGGPGDGGGFSEVPGNDGNDGGFGGTGLGGFGFGFGGFDF